MTNWCINVLHIKGKEKDIKRFKAAAKGQERDGRGTVLCFYDLYKHWIPEERWDWCQDIVEWEAVDAKLEFDDKCHLEYRFATANEPPIKWLRFVTWDYPKLKFTLSYKKKKGGLQGTVKGQHGYLDYAQSGIKNVWGL